MALDERTFLVLNALYLRKIADCRALADCSGFTEQEVRETLASTSSSALVLVLGSQYVLADEGRTSVLEYYDSTYRDMRLDPEVQQWYHQFESVNERFLQLVSAWQVGGGDGPAGERQSKVYERLARLVDRHATELESASKWLPRYGHYATRLRRALDQVDGGKAEYVTSPAVDSLHNVWFEFHEDILALLGRPRETVGG
jgi:hypothetical protein